MTPPVWPPPAGNAPLLRLHLLLAVLLAIAPLASRLEAEEAAVSRATLRRLATRALQADTDDARTTALQALAGHLEGLPEGVREVLPILGRLLREGRVPARLEVLRTVAASSDEVATAFLLTRLDPEVEGHARVWAAVFDHLGARRSDPRVARRLLADLRATTSPTKRALNLEACGALQGPLVRGTLHRAHPDETWVEAAGRARGLARQVDRDSLEVLVGLLRHTHAAVRTAAWEGLVARTGQALRRTPEVWEAWWKQGAPVAAQGTRYDGAPAHADGGGHTPHYYGVPIKRPRARVVFCLDTSQSMYGDGISFAREHLRTTLADLHGTQGFEIIAFHKDLNAFADRVVRAHPVHKWRAIHWLDELETIAYTNLYDAAELAFGHAGRGPRARDDAAALDMIFLLSDGSPNRGRFRVAKRIIKHLGALAGDTLPVHTIGVGRRDEALLRGIAEACGGTYVDVVE